MTVSRPTPSDAVVELIKAPIRRELAGSRFADQMADDVTRAILSALSDAGLAVLEWPSFQERVLLWLLECFGEEIASDQVERNHRFVEEALELAQSCGTTASECHQLVDYVFGRPKGQPSQEVGGVMVTLAALCLAREMDMHEAGETELRRIWGCVEKIRAKQAAKPAHSPLPAFHPSQLEKTDE